ncbi:unnamed protein product [Ceratitis capitata]|uniref:(Mediterranean fruit fly) hypothetical protein n=1 Tax=Ceratitis capitata TaxID=7213 RepID=A0A811U7E3_CERCA|nr:unnamed protein product [Ceratitis capitata]
MRAFIVLCLIAVACADKLGYNYRPVEHSDSGLSLRQGPEGNGLENAAVNLAKLAAEERTAIYVLQKQADLGGLANKLQAQHDVNRNKPEVHFVKYRTPEDAVNAQRCYPIAIRSIGWQVSIA